MAHPNKKKIEYTVDENGCHICTSHKPNKYGYPRAARDGKEWRLNRLIWSRDNGEIPEGLIIRHTCDVRVCINPEHLLLGTYQDNVNDMNSRGRRVTSDQRGSKNGRATITEEIARSIKYEKKLTRKELQEKFNVSKVIVGQIQRVKTWRHI